MRHLFWFRNDLRLHDNEALRAAIANSSEIVPVYILDQRLLEKSRWGFGRLATYRLQFLLESLKDLDDHLKEKGAAGLVFKIGLPEKILPSLCNDLQCSGICASREYTFEEIKVEEALLAAKVNLHLFHTATLYDPDALPFAIDQLPDVFTQFRKRVEKYARVPYPESSPDSIVTPELVIESTPSVEQLLGKVPPPDERRAFSFTGGATAAFERLEYYLWEQNLADTYKDKRNGLIGGDYSTKFSSWLANGSLSARTIYHEVEDYESEVTENKSTYWIKFELLWREYFRMVAMKYGSRIFLPGGIQDKSTTSKNDDKAFYKWAFGNTGDDFVDANMRELLYTGFMSNRGRQNVASYLVHQLKQDWRRGAAWFEFLLIDYDVCSNYGNWMYAAGVGNDSRDRIFNTQKQAKMYDENGAYRALWFYDDRNEPATFYQDYVAIGQTHQIHFAFK